MLLVQRTNATLFFVSAVLALGCEPVSEFIPSVDAGPALGADARGSQDDAAHADAAFDASSAPTQKLDATLTDAAPDAGAADAAHEAGSSVPGDASQQPQDAARAGDGQTATADGATRADLCPDGFARGDASLALTRVAPFAPSPEGVTVCPSGDVFVTVDGPDEIRRVPLDGGAPELYASLSGIQPAGIDCDERGRLFVAGFSRRDGGENPPILLVTAKGAAAVPLPAPDKTAVGGLNGIAVVTGVGVFASDTANGNLLRARELPDGGFETTIVASDLLGANGLMYDAKTRKLYLVVSFLPARVLSFVVGSDGALGDPKEEVSGSLLTFFDGVAVDAVGTLYIADYASGGAVLRGGDQVALASLSDPASLAFRGGTLFVTSYHLGSPETEGGLYALQVGVCGADKRL
jgi:sugar lactone lactonase YvrE